MKKIILFILLSGQLYIQGAATSCEGLASKLNRLATCLTGGSTEQKQAARNEIFSNPSLLNVIKEKAAEVPRGTRPPGTLKPAQAILANLPKEEITTENWLYTAITNSDFKTIYDRASEITPEILTSRDTNGDTPLHIALRELRRPSKKILRNTITGAPIDNKLSNIAELLIGIAQENNVLYTILNTRNNASATPLHELAGFIKETVNLRPKLGKIISKENMPRPDLAAIIHDFNLYKPRTGVVERIDFNAGDETGNTPLHWAAIHGYLELAQALLQNNSDINAQNNAGQTPLMKAIQTGNIALIEKLLEAGANVNIQDITKGRTALHWAQRMREGATLKRGNQMTREEALYVMRLLMNAGADPTLKDLVTTDNPIARSPIEWAIERSPWGNWSSIKPNVLSLSTKWTPETDEAIKAALSDLYNRVERQEEVGLLLNPRYVEIRFRNNVQ